MEVSPDFQIYIIASIKAIFAQKENVILYILYSKEVSYCHYPE